MIEDTASTLAKSVEENSKLMEQILEYAVENVGDIVPIVIERFYQRYPEGEEAFKHHGFERHIRVAAEMVDSVLYCVMSWVERPREIKSIISDTVPHHRSLKIPDELLESLLDVTYEVLNSALPTESEREKCLLEKTVQELRVEIRKA